MVELSRRQFFGLTGGAIAVGLAGCSDEDAEFLVVNTQIIHAPDYRWENAQYPEDIVVRITIENRKSDRQQGILETTLRYEPDDGEGERWSKTEELSEGRGVSPRRTYIFHSVFEEDRDIDDYSVDAEIITAGT